MAIICFLLTHNDLALVLLTCFYFHLFKTEHGNKTSEVFEVFGQPLKR